MSDKAAMARTKSIKIPNLTIFLAFYLLTLSSSLPAIAQSQTHLTNSNNSQAQSQSYHLPSGQSNSQKNNTFQSNNSQSQSSNTQSHSSSPSGQAQQSHSPTKQTSSQTQSQTNQAQSQNNLITSSQTQSQTNQTPSQTQSQAQLSGATLIMPMYRIRNPNGDIIIKFGQPQKSQEEEANGTTPPPPPPPPQNNGTRNRAALSRVFLDHHNKLRAGLNQAPLVWDKKLTHYARRWAAQRAVKCDMNHSSGPFGENIFMGEPGRDWSAETAMQYWMDERVHYDAETNTCKAGEVCGHYTQMIWSRSEKLGCALVECANKGVFVQCNYDPPGNYEGDNPFQ